MDTASDDAKMLYNRGRDLLYGFNCDKNVGQGLHLLELAAARNYPPALVELGCLHFHGRHYSRNHKHGLSLIQQAIDLGCNSAMNTLGVLYAEESLPTHDKAAARYWFQQAAEAEDFEGLFNFALYHELEGAFEEAVKWYRLSAAQNNNRAICSLAALLADGKGAPQDIEEACRLYDWAGDELQDPYGYYGYARLHDDPKYGRQDLETAAGFYFLAADAGVALAQLRYAELAEQGFGDPGAPNDPYVWARVALEHLPDEEVARAQALLARIRSRTGPEEMAAAEQEAKETVDFLRNYGKC